MNQNENKETTKLGSFLCLVCLDFQRDHSQQGEGEASNILLQLLLA